MSSTRNIIGVAVEEGSLSVAEVHASRGRSEVRRTARLPLPEGLSLADPKALGKELRRFLKEHRFSAKQAVLGIPARWVSTRRKSVPPVPAATAAGMLRLQAERDFSSGSDALALDYAGATSATAPTTVLVVAAPRERVQALQVMARFAGLRPRAVTVTVMALAAMAGAGGAAEQMVLSVDSDGADLCAVSGGEVSVVRHLGLDLPPGGGVDARVSSRLAEDVRQAVLLMPRADAHGTSASSSFAVWDGGALPADFAPQLSALLRTPVQRMADLASLGLAAGTPDATGEALACARALALAVAGRAKRLPVDFLHSRLAPPRLGHARRTIVWAAALAATAVIAGAAVFMTWQQDRKEVADLAARLAAQEARLGQAKQFIAGVNTAHGWYDRRPRFLDCLREVTLCFPQEGSIWVTSLALRQDNMQGMITGEAQDQRAVLDVVDKLKGSKRFTEATPLYVRKSSGKTSEVSFAVKFTFKPSER